MLDLRNWRFLSYFEQHWFLLVFISDEATRYVKNVYLNGQGSGNSDTQLLWSLLDCLSYILTKLSSQAPSFIKSCHMNIPDKTAQRRYLRVVSPILFSVEDLFQNLGNYDLNKVILRVQYHCENVGSTPIISHYVHLYSTLKLSLPGYTTSQ